MEDKSPSFCRLCNVALASPSVWRQHAKSDWHIYNLRVRVAEPGTVISPPSGSPRAKRSVDAESNTPSDDESNEESDDESDEGDTELSAVPEFDPEQCLFCGTENDNFDDNLAHMSTAHSFAIPYQDYLLVDLEALVGYLHLVIHGYGECILCASRSTVEGIQQHMTAKGHCRFNVAADIAEFYNKIPELGYQADEESLRLPSGKLLSHRTRATGPAASRTSRQPAERRLDPATLPTATPTNESELVPAQENNNTASTQLSRLTRGDQQSLAHLPDHEVRSLIATSTRHINQFKREETQQQLKLEKASNITLTAHFRADTSKRFRGVWG